MPRSFQVDEMMVGKPGAPQPCRPIDTNLTIRENQIMRIMTATAASHSFAKMLDAVEHGETVAITRGGHTMATKAPAQGRTIRQLRARLKSTPGFYDNFTKDIADTLALVTEPQVTPWPGE